MPIFTGAGRLIPDAQNTLNKRPTMSSSLITPQIVPKTSPPVSTIGFQNKPITNLMSQSVSTPPTNNNITGFFKPNIDLGGALGNYRRPQPLGNYSDLQISQQSPKEQARIAQLKLEEQNQVKSKGQTPPYQDPSDPDTYPGWQIWKSNNPQGTFEQFYNLAVVIPTQVKEVSGIMPPEAIHSSTGLPYEQRIMTSLGSDDLRKRIPEKYF